MNLVIDDAVEVKLATKSDEGKRRPLGMKFSFPKRLSSSNTDVFLKYRSNIAQGRQCLAHPSCLVIANHFAFPFITLQSKSFWDFPLYEELASRKAVRLEDMDG